MGYHIPTNHHQSLPSEAKSEPLRLKMPLNDIRDKQHDWLVRVGWTDHTPLEALALLASEVGEAVNECRGTEPTDKLPEELADVILRTLGLCGFLGIDIEAAVAKKMTLNEHRGTRGRAK